MKTALVKQTFGRQFTSTERSRASVWVRHEERVVEIRNLESPIRPKEIFLPPVVERESKILHHDLVNSCSRLDRARPRKGMRLGLGSRSV